MVQDINPGPDGSYAESSSYGSSYSQSTFSVIDGVAYFAGQRRDRWRRALANRWYSRRHQHGQGHRPRPRQLNAPVADRHQRHALLRRPRWERFNQLWKSDGTATGTTMVQSFTPAQDQGSYPSDLTVVDGTLYFSANDGIDGNQVWKSDGTANGTTMVSDFQLADAPYDSPQNFSSFVGLNGTLFFEAAGEIDSATSSIYRSDGTPGGTSPIFTPDSSNEGITGLTVSGGSLYFLTTETEGTGTAVNLWKSDGTASGTVLVTSIPNIYNPGNLTAVNGILYFSTQTDSPAPNTHTSSGKRTAPRRVRRK